MCRIFNYTIVIVIMLTAGLLEAAERKKIFTDYSLAAGDSVEQDIIVYNGDATVKGFLDGNLTVYNGDIRIEDEGQVTGILKSYAGKVYRQDGVDEKSSFYVIRKIKEYVVSFDLLSGMLIEEEDTEDRELTEDEDEWEVSTDSEEDDMLESFVRHHSFINKKFLNYSKVEGLYLGLYPQFNLINSDIIDLDLEVFGGYAFRMEDWQYYLQQKMTVFDNFFVGGMQYDQVASEDRWKVNQGLNFLSSLFLHEDFYNYYRMSGLGFFGGTAFQFKEGKSTFLLKAEYDRAEIDSLRNRTDYALFGNNKSYSRNLHAEEGKLEQMIISAFYNDALPFINTDYKLFASYETSVGSSDYDYEKGIFSIYFKTSIAKRISFANYLRLESSTSTSPNFKRTALGGIGTLPGYGLNTIGSVKDSRSSAWDTGARGILANKCLLNSFVVSYPQNDSFQYKCIFDFGDAWYTDSDDLAAGFEGVSTTNLKSSLGVGISFKEVIQVSLHKRLDSNHKPYQVQASVVVHVDDFVR